MASIILFLILSLIFRKNNQSLFFFFTDEAKDMNPDSDTILNIKYKISGDRNHGSHTPMFEDESSQMLTFKSALVLQRPVLEPCLAVGFLPLLLVILTRVVKRTKQRHRHLVKVRWDTNRGPEFTYEHEKQSIRKFPTS